MKREREMKGRCQRQRPSSEIAAINLLYLCRHRNLWQIKLPQHKQMTWRAALIRSRDEETRLHWRLKAELLFLQKEIYLNYKMHVVATLLQDEK